MQSRGSRHLGKTNSIATTWVVDRRSLEPVFPPVRSLEGIPRGHILADLEGRLCLQPTIPREVGICV